MILVLTEPFDPHADHVCEMLGQRGAGVLRFNPADFPVRANFSLGYAANGEVSACMRRGEEVINLAELQSVWFRRPKRPVPHEHIQNEAERRLVADECQMFLRDLWNAVPGRWLPGRPAAIQRAELKGSQLALAGELGFELPPTLITSNPDEFLEFYTKHNGNIVNKVAGFGMDGGLREKFTRYTEVVSKRHIGYAESVKFCPVILQAYVPKKLELRITIVGRKVFAAEIHSQETNHTRHDWRRYDLGRTPHLPHDLPAEVGGRCVRMVERLELIYGAIDMVLTPDGRYVFIEINPNGQYLWIEEETGLPISAAICAVLMNSESGARALP